MPETQVIGRYQDFKSTFWIINLESGTLVIFHI